MLRRLFQNTVFSAISFTAASAIAILLVPLLIKAYGVYGFGLIMLARIFLPTGVFAVLEFGVSEVATQVVARARAGAPWDAASRQLTLLLALVVSVGVLTSASLFAFSAVIPGFLKIEGAPAEEFAAVLRWTALATVALLPALVFDGIMKGFERFGLLRAMELLSTLGYAIATYYAVKRGAGFESVAYIFLASIVVRVCVVAFVAGLLAHFEGVKLRRWQDADRRDVFVRCRLMFQGKLLGIAQSQVPPLIVGSLVGPGGVGIYDLLVRIPRFCKAVLALLNSALIPVAARIEQTVDLDTQRRLGTIGLLLIPAVAVPPLASVAAFSEPLLRLWVGADLAPYWIWHAAMIVVPISLTAIGFGTTALQVRTDALKSLLKLTALQILVQYIVSLAFVPLLAERAFVLGQIVAAPLLLFWQLHLIAHHQGVPSRLRNQLWLILALGAPLVVLTTIAPLEFVDGVVKLLACAAMWTIVYWGLIFLLVVTPTQRQTLLVLMKRLRPARDAT